MCIDERQIAAIKAVFAGYELILAAAGHYTCEKGNKIAADLSRLQAEQLAEDLETIKNMLEKYTAQ